MRAPRHRFLLFQLCQLFRMSRRRFHLWTPICLGMINWASCLPYLPYLPWFRRRLRRSLSTPTQAQTTSRRRARLPLPMSLPELASRKRACSNKRNKRNKRKLHRS
mmetsp:Transcript_4227/g.16494  ORF Transcript_4227/g.16494 Transcript_4227/m.16494 type:complete len:106 (-) Transcript_4227:1327-1644(-)